MKILILFASTFPYILVFLDAFQMFFLQRVAQWFKAFQLSQEGFLFKPHWVLSWVFGPNLVTSVLVTLGLQMRNRGLKVAQRW